MIKLLLIISIFLTVTSISEESFMNSVKEGYDKYIVIIDEEREVGDLTICFGSVNNKYYLACYLLNTTGGNHQIMVKNGKKTTTFVMDGGVVAGYGLELKKTDTIDIYIINEENELFVAEIAVDSLITDLNNNGLSGEATGKFPKNKREVNLINRLRIYILVFIFAALFLGVFLVIM